MRKTILLSAALLLAARTAAAQEQPPPSLEELQREYEKIREGLFTARVRAAAVAQAVHSARVVVHLRYATPRFFAVSRATVRLDGATVYEDTTGAIAADDVQRWSGFVAPGRHQLSIRVDAETRDDPGYTTSSESTITIDVPARRQVTLRAVAEDAGDMGYSWGKKNKGSYKLRLDVAAEGKALDAAKR